VFSHFPELTSWEKMGKRHGSLALSVESTGKVSETFGKQNILIYTNVVALWIEMK